MSLEEQLKYVTSPHMQAILKEKKQIADKYKNIETAIASLQKICDHRGWVYIGHDSHYNHAICPHCGEIDYKAG